MTDFYVPTLSYDAATSLLFKSLGQSSERCESQYFPFNRPLRDEVSYSMMKTFVRWKAAIVVIVAQYSTVVSSIVSPTFSSILFLPLCSRSSASGQWRGTVWPPRSGSSSTYVVLVVAVRVRSAAGIGKSSHQRLFSSCRHKRLHCSSLRLGWASEARGKQAKERWAIGHWPSIKSLTTSLTISEKKRRENWLFSAVAK